MLVILGLAKEFECGDKNIDQKFFILSDETLNLKPLFGDDEFKKSISELFSLPIATLYSNNKRIWFRTDYKKMRAAVKSGEAVKDINFSRIQALKNLTEIINSISFHRVSEFKKEKLRQALIILSIHAALFALAITGFFPIIMDSAVTLDDNLLIKHVLLFGGLAVCAWFLILFFGFSKTSWFGWVLSDFLIFGVIGVLGSWFFLAREANIRLDLSAPVIRVTPLAGRTCTLFCKGGRRNSKTYNLSLDQCLMPEKTLAYYQDKDWKCRRRARYNYFLYFFPFTKGEKYSKFNVSRNVFMSGMTGDDFEIPVYRGALNFEWVDQDTIRRSNN